MFTGLIESQGILGSIERRAASLLLKIRPENRALTVAPGGSLCVDGVCLTVEETRGGELRCTAVRETVERTTIGLARTGTRVNLERSLPADGRLDGHFVLGHVDGMGTLAGDLAEGVGRRLTFAVPESCMPLMAEKGSVAIDGISLTIAALGAASIEIAVIPATLGATTLGRKRMGDRVNIEVDVIARYLSRLAGGDRAKMDGGVSLLEQMERAGF